ncbi:T9SS type A sorting domain-containing protein [Flavobacterium amnicola]|uniref:T9SS type A sorting domain-containing protein n=1 Tax=Flavobacterium amnicola TaxID=2506422 RepID=A0A4Q1K2Z8_9FLAO|nr:T9SS type A sorting domain-containing protein [Flavobacterium amnicola]
MYKFFKLTFFTFLISLLFSCDSTQQSATQAEWRALPAPISEGRYDDVFFLNKDLGWAADGRGKKVYKTTDGGLNWIEQLHLPGAYLRNIEFLNENIGFLGTLTNKFYKTVDGGQNWEIVTNIPQPTIAICGLDTVGKSTIYGCGTYFGPAYIIKSTDSGQTWQFIDMSAYAEALVEVLFVTENIGYASGGDANGGVVLKTTDGGNSWTEIYNTNLPGEWVWKLQKLQSEPNVFFGSVASYSPNKGKLIKSFDGGANWVSLEVPDTDVQAVGFISKTHGWMGGHNSGFLETFDGGYTWHDTKFGGNLNRIQILNDDLAFCSGTTIYKYSAGVNLNGVFGGSVNAKKERLNINLNPIVTNNNLNFSINFKDKNHIIIKLFNANGKHIKTLKNETIQASEIKNYSFPFPYEKGNYYLNLHDDEGGQSEMIIKK